MAKYIKIPKPVVFKNLLDGEPIAGEQPMTLRAFIVVLCFEHPAWSKNPEGARAAADVVEALDRSGGEPGSFVELSGTVYDRLAQTVRHPQYAVNRGVGDKEIHDGYRNLTTVAIVQLVPIIDAVLNAVDAPAELKPVA